MADQIFVEETPADIKNAKGLDLITASTPNGQKAQIFAEELIEAYGTGFTYTVIDIFAGVQRNDWFTRLNPNGLIPVLIDNTKSPPFPLSESSAILLYLQKHIDTTFKFGFRDERESYECLQWLLFWHGTGANAQGQTNFYCKFASEKLPFAIDFSRKQALRVFNVLEIRLSNKYQQQQHSNNNTTTTMEPEHQQPSPSERTYREYLVGAVPGTYSIADMGIWPWVKGWRFSGFSDEEMAKFPALLQWVDRIAQRPAVKRAVEGKYDPEGKMPDF